MIPQCSAAYRWWSPCSSWLCRWVRSTFGVLSEACRRGDLSWYLQAAIANDFWMVQRRQLEVNVKWMGVGGVSLHSVCTLCTQVLQAMPEEAANRMVAGLFQRRRMSAGLLALFAQQLSRLHLEAAACWGRPADWLLSAGKCR